MRTARSSPSTPPGRGGRRARRREKRTSPDARLIGPAPERHLFAREGTRSSGLKETSDKQAILEYLGVHAEREEEGGGEDASFLSREGDSSKGDHTHLGAWEKCPCRVKLLRHSSRSLRLGGEEKGRGKASTCVRSTRKRVGHSWMTSSSGKERRERSQKERNETARTVGSCKRGGEKVSSS